VFVYYLGGLQANLPSVAGLLPRRRGFVSRSVHVILICVEQSGTGTGSPSTSVSFGIIRYNSVSFGIIPPMLHAHLQLYVSLVSSTTGRNLGSCSALWVLWDNGRKSALTLAFNQTAVKKLVLVKNKGTSLLGGGGGAPRGLGPEG